MTTFPLTTGSGVLRASSIFVGRSMRHSMRDVESLLMAVILPVMMLLLFTFVFGGAMDVGAGARTDYLTYVVPGIILTCAGFGAAGTGVSVSQDMTTGTMNRLRTMPIPSATVLAGHTLASLARNLVSTALVVVVAVAVGFRPGAGILGWVVATGSVALWILAITALFAMLGLIAESPQAASGYGFILLFLPYASSAFAPIETMPAWMQPFATHQPVTPVIETIRTALAGGSVGSEALVALAWSVGVIAVAVALTAWFFPRRVAR
ncbi:ABC transporter permease [Pseudactinotalea sp. Z1739]|uniref:ABC transporter permease n=1 Tax=Pseudactinotalea sp. Z1739 TaxID=3413028 RepID=UPI003C7CA244